MDELRVSEDTLLMLRRFGWHEDRSINCDAAIAFARSQGIEVSETASEFLRSFSGIRLYPPPDGGLSWVLFDIVEAWKCFTFEELLKLEAIVSKRLCPIGFGGRWILLISADAEVFFLQDEWLTLLRAKSVYGAFEFILKLDSKDYEEIPLPFEDRASINWLLSARNPWE
jgi:hypothetical protein